MESLAFLEERQKEIEEMSQEEFDKRVRETGLENFIKELKGENND